MQPDIHPSYGEVVVTCNCGNKFKTRSTLAETKGGVLLVEVCANCHPFYTGKQKLVDTAGRVDRFNKRYASQKIVQEKAAAEQTQKETQQAEVKSAKAKTAPAKLKKSKVKKG